MEGYQSTYDCGRRHSLLCNCSAGSERP
jgi:hypothetical protein